jgi:AraC-like DNA-binding protein
MMVLYISISSALTLSQNDVDPRAQSMVSLTLSDPNSSGFPSESKPSFTMTLPRNSLPELFLRMYYKFREMDDESLRKLEQALLEGRSVSSDSGRRFPQWLERVRNILEQRFAEPYKLSEIAAEAGVHPVHLAREFRKYYGTSVGEYLRRVRIEYACRELMGSNAAVTNIAFAAGFADQSHFSRTFKRLCGTTPGRYRGLFCHKEAPKAQKGAADV